MGNSDVLSLALSILSEADLSAISTVCL